MNNFVLYISIVPLCSNSNQMKRQLYILTIVLAASAAGSQAFANADTRISSIRNVDELLLTPEISYNKEVIESPGWRDNWFFGVNAGANAFVGSPKDAPICGGESSRISVPMQGNGSHLPSGVGYLSAVSS